MGIVQGPEGLLADVNAIQRRLGEVDPCRSRSAAAGGAHGSRADVRLTTTLIGVGARGSVLWRRPSAYGVPVQDDGKRSCRLIDDGVHQKPLAIV